MNRFHRFASLRWVYSLIVPPRYRAKLNITEELQSVEKTLDKTIEQVNRNSEAIDELLAGGGSPVNGDEIINKILDPDNYPLSENTESESYNVTLEVGKLSKSGGGERDGEGGLRMVDYLAVNAFYSFIKPVFETTDGETALTALFYTVDKAYTGKYFVIEKNKFFDLSNAPKDAVYVRCYISTDDETGSLALVCSNEADTAQKAEHKKIYMADHGYSIYGASIDDETMHKIVVEAEGKDENTYNITEIRAPKSNPEEATLCLMNSGNGISQFVDFSSMAYNPDKPTVEIVCQSRGGKPLPVFSVGFNNGKGGRVKKLTVHPDATPIELTRTGIVGNTPAAIDLSRLGPDNEGKGYIVETYPNGYTQETELTYENGKITKIKDGNGNDTVLVWGTVSHTITYNAPNCTIDPMPETVDGGGRLELLAWSNEGYNLDTIQVTMGGVDISDRAVAQQGNDAQLRIENVTGDVVITITTIGG